MTAAQPYSISEEEGKRESELKEEPRDRGQEALHKRIDAEVLDLSVLAGSLGTVAELMLNADVKCDTVAVGVIIDHYIRLINDGLGRIEVFLADDMRRGE